MKISQKSKILPIVVVIVLGIGFSVYFFDGEAQVEPYSGPPKALIIDQLYQDMPNLEFHFKATEYLETAGYTVDIVTTEDVTVDFYKELPKMNYKYVVVRTHGAENIDNVVLFTGEKYTEEQYIQEQLLGQVSKAAPLLETAYKVTEEGSSDWVIVNSSYRYLSTPANRVDNSENEFFAISPNLVSHGMNGKFDGTIFLLGGCNTLSNPSLAKSLTDRGASMVVGWDNTVSNRDNDYALLGFLEKTLVENYEVDAALDRLSKNLNPEHMSYPAAFDYYT